MTERDRKPDQESEVQESADSLLRAVARASSVDMHAASTLEAQDEFSYDGPAARLPDAGDVIDERYELLSMLGAGGMGAVYAARNLRTGKEVALKVLLPNQRFRSERLARFVREARAAGRIRHPNVVDVYDVEGDAETPYIVMERLYGQSLGERMKAERLLPEEAVRILIAAMRGVAEAHRQGVIHRDLKPENIFLAEQSHGEGAVAKVLDFGVSRVLSREGTEKALTTITRTGYVVGTPSYMPLEQLRGTVEVDGRADVYALGVILYEALTGERPYQAQNNHDLVIQMVTGEPTPLSNKVRTFDRALESIIMKALARDVEARFATVASFAAALQRWLDGDRAVEGARHGLSGYKLGLTVLTVLLLASALSWALFSARRPVEHVTPARTAVGEAPPGSAQAGTKPENAVPLVVPPSAGQPEAAPPVLLLSPASTPDPEVVAKPAVAKPLHAKKRRASATPPLPAPEVTPKAEEPALEFRADEF